MLEALRLSLDASAVLKGLSRRIVAGELAAAIYAAAVAISIGLLDSACMTPPV